MGGRTGEVTGVSERAVSKGGLGHQQSASAGTPVHSSLLSARARELYLADPSASQQTFAQKFWKGLKDVFSPIQVCETVIPDPRNFEVYSEAGLSPFCEIRGQVLWVKESQKQIVFLLVSNNMATSISRLFDAQISQEAALLAFLYLTAVKDDLAVDENEAAALLATTRLFQTKAATVDEAKNYVLQTIMRHLTDDKNYAEEDKGLVTTITQALGLSDKGASVAALGAYLLQTQAAGKKTLNDDIILQLQKLGTDLGVSGQIVQGEIGALETMLFVQKCARGELPVLSRSPINLKSKETAHYRCEVMVIRQKTQVKTHRGYAGTRIKIGKVPVYLGGSSPFQTTREVAEIVGVGQMVITNKRIVCVGTKINYTIPLDSVLDVPLFEGFIQINAEGRYGGRFYQMDAPIKAKAVISALLAKGNTTSRRERQ